MNKVKGILLDIDYVTGKNQELCIKLYVKTDKGITAFSDKEYKPYFYVLVEDSEKQKKELEEKEFGDNEKFRILKVEEVRKANAENVLKLSFANPQQLTTAREEVKELHGIIERREYDIPFVKRYLIDHSLQPMNGIEIELEKEGQIKKVKSFEEKELLKKLNIAAFDLETYSPERFSDPKQDPILSISFADGKQSKVFTSKANKNKATVPVKDEKEMIKALIKEIKDKKIDVLVTYNGDRFDFPYLKERAKQLGIKLGIGLDGEEPVLKKKGLFFAAEVTGIPHLDAYQLVLFITRIGALNLIKFDLESVVREIFGREKSKLKPEKINEIWDTGKGLEELVDYNKEDAESTREIALEYLPLMVELSKLVKQTLFEVSRGSTGILVEYLLISKSFESNLLLPNRPSEAEIKQRMLQSFKGGYVKEPLPGLHENIAVLDFRSLHPSIMISHNISADTLRCECCKEKPVHLAPTGDWFCSKKKGFISSILEEILKKRIHAKKEMKNLKEDSLEFKSLSAKQHGLKILLNSFYGSLGYARFRWYSRECAKAVTAWSRHYIQEVNRKAEEAGFISLYSDSVTKERTLLLKNSNGEIELQSAEEFFNSIDRLAHHRGGKQLKPVEGYRTLSVNPKTLEPEWKNIEEIIRHKANKKIYRVNQKFGETRVTEDHSLIIKERGKLVEVRPNELENRKLFSTDIPKEEFTTKKIDLYSELKNYHFDSLYKDTLKINQFHAEDNWIWFGWKNMKKKIKLKRVLEVDSPEFESLCRLLGAYIAEGSSSTMETTSSRWGVSISSSDTEWLKGLRKDYHNLFENSLTCIIQSTKKERILTYTHHNLTKTIQYTDNTRKMQMMNQLAAIFFKVLCGQKSSGKKLPNFIFNVPDTYKKILLHKMIEGDGSRSVNKRLGYTREYIKKNFKYTSKSLKTISGLSLLLKQLNQKHTILYRPSKQAYSIQTCSKHNERVVTKITEEKYGGFVYDLSVEGNNNFVDGCGQILLHNTDSALLILPKNKSEKDILEFVKKINSELPGAMELEFEGMFKRGIFVTKKEGGAAKKRYALIDFNNKLKIVGFEYVRRDWARIAKDTQKEVIEAVLKEGKPDKAIGLVREKIEKLKKGEVEKKDLIIVTQIKKPLNKYETIGPHIAAAKKAIARGKEVGFGSLIEFIITRTGKSISDKAELEEFVKQGDYDADYYIEHQVIPAVLKIMRELGCEKEDLIQGGKQSSLAAFV